MAWLAMGGGHGRRFHHYGGDVLVGQSSYKPKRIGDQASAAYSGSCRDDFRDGGSPSRAGHERPAVRVCFGAAQRR
jgi:hypothetical protein